MKILDTFAEGIYTERVYTIKENLTKVIVPVVHYDTNKFNRLVKFISVYRNDDCIKIGHYIVSVPKELDKKFLCNIHVVADPHGYCLAPWMDTTPFVNKGRLVDTSLLPDLVKANLVEQFGHLVD